MRCKILSVYQSCRQLTNSDTACYLSRFDGHNGASKPSTDRRPLPRSLPHSAARKLEGVAACTGHYYFRPPLPLQCRRLTCHLGVIDDQLPIHATRVPCPLCAIVWNGVDALSVAAKLRVCLRSLFLVSVFSCRCREDTRQDRQLASQKEMEDEEEEIVKL